MLGSRPRDWKSEKRPFSCKLSSLAAWIRSGYSFLLTHGAHLIVVARTQLSELETMDPDGASSSILQTSLRGMLTDESASPNTEVHQDLMGVPDAESDCDVGEVDAGEAGSLAELACDEKDHHQRMSRQDKRAIRKDHKRAVKVSCVFIPLCSLLCPGCTT